MNGILDHFPYKYLDARVEIRVKEARDGEYALVRASAESVFVARARRGLSVARAVLHEVVPNAGGAAAGAAGTAFSAVWFNRPYTKKNLIPHTEYLFFGKAEIQKNGKLQLLNPLFEKADNLKRLGKILPLYRKFESGGTVLPAYKAQSILQKALKENASDSSLYREIHCPTSVEGAAAARRTLQTRELSVKLAVYSILRERNAGLKRRTVYGATNGQIADFLKSFPFTLTGDQMNAIREIARDLRGPAVMNRLLEGDVGSGKTAVAFTALYMAAASGHQAVFMAPTEILARQHYQNALKVFSNMPFNIALLTGSMKKAERETAYFNIRYGNCAVVIGTHSVFSAGVEFRDLALAVTDEQHRFGVAQRGAIEKKGALPDVLALSATPIPRTLSLALYGDLQLSRLHAARVARDVMTSYVGAEKVSAMYGFIAGRLAQNERAYFICPRVEGDEDGESGGEDFGGGSEGKPLTGVKTLSAALRETPPAAFGIGTLHGRMKEAEKNKVLSSFAAGEIRCLVSTTVVEVGIDVSEATVMVICDADRFGLSQLHQLRGRVGRKGQKAWCFLLSGGDLDEPAVNRLNVLKTTDDGFKLAEYDYEQRGAGEFLGLKQHGRADLPVSADMIRDARELADALLRDEKTRSDLERAADLAGDGDLGEVTFN
ncbi:ATP-dependent DNA helicase RecG [Clostridia bacterium]|nr:ATP-dependent DNA helicase RecG [Clostridia bacterium]